jgi:LysM repeat protein
VIKSGDTLGSVAAKYNTTVEKVMALNPGVDPTSLHIGQRIRVG